jgi:hypothetical protein
MGLVSSNRGGKYKNKRYGKRNIPNGASSCCHHQYSNLVIFSEFLECFVPCRERGCPVNSSEMNLAFLEMLFDQIQSSCPAREDDAKQP